LYRYLEDHKGDHGKQYSKKKAAVPVEEDEAEKDEEYDQLQSELSVMPWNEEFVGDLPWKKKSATRNLEDIDESESDTDDEHSIASRNVSHRQLQSHYSESRSRKRSRDKESEESSSDEEEEEEVVTKKKKTSKGKKRAPRVSYP